MVRFQFPSRSIAAVLAAVAMTFLLSPSAQASFHLWKLVQVFSNADGSQQFIEMSEDFDGEQFFKTDNGGPFGPAQLFSDSKSFTFPNDLPGPDIVGHDTAGQHVLLATTGFFPNNLKPDFLLPSGFVTTGAGSLTYTPNDPTLVLDKMSWNSLPTNGTDALFQTAGTTSQTTEVAAPHNFTGAANGTGIPLPPAAWAGIAGLVIVAVAHRKSSPLAAKGE
jgi:hypothetical protein